MVGDCCYCYIISFHSERSLLITLKNILFAVHICFVFIFKQNIFYTKCYRSDIISIYWNIMIYYSYLSLRHNHIYILLSIVLYVKFVSLFLWYRIFCYSFYVDYERTKIFTILLFRCRRHMFLEFVTLGMREQNSISFFPIFFIYQIHRRFQNREMHIFIE